MSARTSQRALMAALLVLAAASCKESSRPPTTPPPSSEKFLSDTDPLYGRLEELQRETGACEDPLPLAQSTEIIRQWLDEECKKPQQQWQCKESYRGLDTLSRLKPTTRCESGLGFSGPALYSLKLDSVLATNVARPRIGTVRTGDINAYAVRFDSPQDYLVVFNPDLGQLHREILRYVLNLVDISGEVGGELTVSFSARKARERMAADPEQAQYFAQLLAAAVRAQKLPFAPDLERVTPDRFETLHRSVLHERLAAAMADQAEGFVVAHEFAHAGLDHGADSGEALNISGVAHPVEVATRPVDEELAADQAGLTLWLAVMSKDDDIDRPLLAWLMSAPDTFFTCARLLELERQISGLAPVPGYPSADLRRHRIREVLGAQGLLATKSGPDFGEVFHLAALVAWARVHSARLTELHDKGVDIPLEQIDE